MFNANEYADRVTAIRADFDAMRQFESEPQKNGVDFAFIWEQSTQAHIEAIAADHVRDVIAMCDLDGRDWNTPEIHSIEDCEFDIDAIADEIQTDRHTTRGDLQRAVTRAFVRAADRRAELQARGPVHLSADAAEWAEATGSDYFADVAALRNGETTIADFATLVFVGCADEYISGAGGYLASVADRCGLSDELAAVLAELDAQASK